MRDEELRGLERAWRASKSLQDWTAWAKSAARSGEGRPAELLRAAARVDGVERRLMRARARRFRGGGGADEAEWSRIITALVSLGVRQATRARRLFGALEDLGWAPPVRVDVREAATSPEGWLVRSAFDSRDRRAARRSRARREAPNLGVQRVYPRRAGTPDAPVDTTRTQEERDLDLIRAFLEGRAEDVAPEFRGLHQMLTASRARRGSTGPEVTGRERRLVEEAVRTLDERRPGRGRRGLAGLTRSMVVLEEVEHFVASEVDHVHPWLRGTHEELRGRDGPIGEEDVRILLGALREVSETRGLLMGLRDLLRREAPRLSREDVAQRLRGSRPPWRER